MRKNKILNEILATAGNYILEGGKIPAFKGDVKKVKALKEVIKASRKLYETLSNENNSIEMVNEALNNKKEAAVKFKEEFGVIWPF